jgi:hypothetical protein
MNTQAKIAISIGVVLGLLSFSSFFGSATPEAFDGPSDSNTSSQQPNIFFGEETRFGFQANFGGPGGGYWKNTIIKHTWVFLPDGVMYRQLPEDGDMIGYCTHQVSGNPCLGYEINGDVVTVTESDGGQSQYTIDGNSITIKPKVILRKVDVATPEILDGIWKRSNLAISSGAGGSVSTSSQQAISFGSDGSFQNSQFSGFVGGGSAAGGYASRKGIEKGTYSLDGYFITLQYEDGFAAKHIIFKSPGEELIAIDGRTFIR